MDKDLEDYVKDALRGSAETIEKLIDVTGGE